MGKGCIAVMVITMIGLIVVSMVTADSGSATFYTPPYVPSACYGFQDSGVMIGAASSEIWNDGAACGTRYTMTCTGATNEGVAQPCSGSSVTVTIVDFCPPPGCKGTIDLSQEAFSVIADPKAARVTIDYQLA